MNEREKMLAGEMYDPFDPDLMAGRERARDLCQELNATRESQQDERRQDHDERQGRPVACPGAPPMHECNCCGQQESRIGQRVDRLGPETGADALAVEMDWLGPVPAPFLGSANQTLL